MVIAVEVVGPIFHHLCYLEIGLCFLGQWREMFCSKSHERSWSELVV